MHRRGALCRKSVDGGRDTGWTNRPSLIRYKFTCNNISVSPDEPPRFLSRLTNVSFRFFFISRFDDIVIVVKYYYFYYYRSICGSGIFVFVQRSFPFWILSFWSHREKTEETIYRGWKSAQWIFKSYVLGGIRVSGLQDDNGAYSLICFALVGK